MSPPDRNPPSQPDHLRCSKCGARSMLTHIEPSPKPDHDVRTFECPSCGQVDVVTVKFR